MKKIQFYCLQFSWKIPFVSLRYQIYEIPFVSLCYQIYERSCPASIRNIHAWEMARLPALQMKYFNLQSKVTVSQPSYFFTVWECVVSPPLDKVCEGGCRQNTFCLLWMLLFVTQVNVLLKSKSGN